MKYVFMFNSNINSFAYSIQNVWQCTCLKMEAPKKFFFLVARTLRGEDGGKGPAIKEENNEFLSRKKKKQPLKIIFFF